MNQQPAIAQYNEQVLLKYRIYNSMFTNLPFDTVKNTGVLLPLLQKACTKSFNEGLDSKQIIQAFFEKYELGEKGKIPVGLLFNFVQFIERQVVLFDAIEEVAFPKIHNMDGLGSLQNVKERAVNHDLIDELKAHLSKAKVKIVLTAHPTQFYPAEVLAIITDLSSAIEQDDFTSVQDLLAQLGKTAFFKHEKPTPYEEAERLVWYLDNIFYQTLAEIYTYINRQIFESEALHHPVLEIGFWPGGDRDGNPFVTSKTTLKVATKLKHNLLKNYHNDVKYLKRRLSFKGLTQEVSVLEEKLYEAYLNPSKKIITEKEMRKMLQKVKEDILTNHDGLFVDLIDDLLHKLDLFGMHFAALDIRQDSRIHSAVFENLLKLSGQKLPPEFSKIAKDAQLNILLELAKNFPTKGIKDEMAQRTVDSFIAMKKIQRSNGEKAAHRYVISNTSSAQNVMEVFAMLKGMVFQKDMKVDVVPLFETVRDLHNAAQEMQILYRNDTYRKHLKSRGHKQHIMLGFSDGTKDGGYLMSNWSIYQAKEQLTAMSRKYDVKVIFFDGRGGPPARGGGKTHQFYASLGKNIEHDEIQMTVQGQTISSHYGSLAAAQYNIEQLLSASIENAVFYDEKNTLSDKNRDLLNQLAQRGFEAYSAFKKHPKFISYLEEISTLKYYGKTNIGSRPSKRKQSDTLVFKDLRAIPFVGAWSGLKQNVPGFFGVGTALQSFLEAHRWEDIENLYHESEFFKAIIENSAMSLKKSFFPLTAYLKNDPSYGAFWQLIYEEYKLTKNLILRLTGQSDLMENYPESMASIEMREKIVLPLLTIQQYALQELQELKKQPKKNKNLIEVYEKLVVRSLYGNVNASRNSA